MIHSKTPKDNSSDPSSLGNAADYSGPGASGVPSETDRPAAALPPPIAPAHSPLLSDGSAAPTKEDLGFEFDIDDPHVDIDAVHTRLASDFALFFYGHVKSWHVEEIAEAAIRWAIASGELMVANKASIVQVPFIAREGSTIAGCSECGQPGVSSLWKFCPGCGSTLLPL